ncbi:MAG: hypothetical protein ACYTHJ_17640 [Planctomycetota bacterium]|jgi:hypothetical protein
MQLSRLFLRFALLITLTSVLLFNPWIGRIERAYVQAFRAVGNVFFQQFWFWDEAYAAFIDLNSTSIRSQVKAATSDVFRVYNPRTGSHDPYPFPERMPVLKAHRVFDTLIVCMHRQAMRRMIDERRTRGSPFGQVRISSKITGYWPMAFILALILAKPNRLLRKLWAILLGLAITQLFVLVRVSLLMLDTCFAVPGKSYTIFTPGETSSWLLRQAKTIFVDNPTMSFTVPLVIWMLVAVTREDWAKLFGLLSGMSLGSEPEEYEDGEGESESDSDG